MANGDPLRVGLVQPPDNRADSDTMLVHTGSAFGTQSASFLVRRLGSPSGRAAIHGENFSTGPGGPDTRVGVIGMVSATTADVGVLGTSTVGPAAAMFGTIGVMGLTNTIGVAGRGLGGIIEDGAQILGSSVGVLGEAPAGIGVRGVATDGFGVVGESSRRAGVTGTSVSAAVKVFGRRPCDGGVAYSRAGVRKPPKEETAMGERRRCGSHYAEKSAGAGFDARRFSITVSLEIRAQLGRSARVLLMGI